MGTVAASGHAQHGRAQWLTTLVLATTGWLLAASVSPTASHAASPACAPAPVELAAVAAPLLALDAMAKSAPASARTLQVFAAASLMDAFHELGRQLEKSQPGLTVRFNFGGSQQLAIQLEQGAAADVFASADERWMTYVSERGLIRDTAQVFARNQLVVIVPNTNPARIRKLQDLSRAGVKLVIGADAVPVGRYSRQALQLLARDPSFGGDFATRVLRNVVSEEENVKSVAGKVQLGEADAGVVYRSDVTPAVARFLKVMQLPESAQITPSYWVGIMGSATEFNGARAFLELMLSPQGQQVLQKRGLMPAAAAQP